MEHNGSVNGTNTTGLCAIDSFSVRPYAAGPRQAVRQSPCPWLSSCPLQPQCWWVCYCISTKESCTINHTVSCSIISKQWSHTHTSPQTNETWPSTWWNKAVLRKWTLSHIEKREPCLNHQHVKWHCGIQYGVQCYSVRLVLKQTKNICSTT
jgi:hypothetical protein